MNDDEFPREDWKIEVAVGNTTLGYSAWVAEMREAARGFELLDEQYEEELK